MGKKIKFPVYERHPLSEVFTDMDEDSLAALEADIRENDLNNPVLLYEDMVLDGWHRYQCLRNIYKTGIDEDFLGTYFEEFDPEVEDISPEKFVYSANLHRRHLSLYDKIAITAQMLGKGLEERGVQTAVAKELGIAKATVNRAIRDATKSTEKKVKEEAAPTLEGLEKRKALLEAQLAKVEEQIVELQSTAKPKRGVARRPR